MSNHVHLLLTPPSVIAASKTMQSVNQRYAQIRNLSRVASGKLFEERFYSDPIQSAAHLAFSVLYINANPYVAHMRKSSEYHWSTHALHSGEGSRVIDSMIEFDSWYSALGASQNERAKNYRECFDNYLGGDFDSSYVERALQMEPPELNQRRFERPNRSSAREQVSRYAKKRK